MAEEAKTIFYDTKKDEKSVIEFTLFLFDDGKSGVFNEQLLRADVAEIDGGLRFIACAFDVGDGADAETLMFDDVSDFQGASRSR